MAPSGSAAQSTSVAPTENGIEVFPTTEGANVKLQWQPGSHALVRDAYVGNTDVTPGVWHDGRYGHPELATHHLRPVGLPARGASRLQ